MTRGPDTWPIDGRLDPEVRERLNERLRRALGRLRGLAACSARAPQERPVGQPVVPGRRRSVEEPLLEGAAFSPDVVSASSPGPTCSASRPDEIRPLHLALELVDEQRGISGRSELGVGGKDVPVVPHAVDGRRSAPWACGSAARTAVAVVAGRSGGLPGPCGARRGWPRGRRMAEPGAAPRHP